MKHFIYLTTNLVTNEKYIGKHYGELDDDYLGSGTILKRAIEKYGKENFKREILYISKDYQENCQKEKEFIKLYNAVKDRTFYNISEGGDGGDIFHLLSIEQQEAIREAARERSLGEKNPRYGVHLSEATKKKFVKIEILIICKQSRIKKECLKLCKVQKMECMEGNILKSLNKK